MHKEDDVGVRLKRKQPLPAGSIIFDLPFRFNYFISAPRGAKNTKQFHYSLADSR